MRPLSVLLLFLTITSFGQVKFEKGYFIDNNKVRTDCFIKNVEWNDTPSLFEYKVTEDGAVQSKRDVEVVEFMVGNTRFISVTVDMDYSPDHAQRLSTHKNPDFENVRIFMKQLTDGNAKLYRYSKNDLKRFFFQIGSGKIKQLVFKRYNTDNSRLTIAKNNMFRQQLANEVKCASETNSLEKIAKLDYSQDDLTKYFESVNLCDGSQIKNSEAKVRKEDFNLKGAVILGMHRLGFDGTQASYDFESKTYVTFGVEAEYILPVHNNKWSIILEPTFMSYKATAETADDKFDVKFSYIAASLGFRHYFFLNDKAKLFANTGVNYSAISSSSKMDFLPPSPNYQTYEFSNNSLILFVGAGISYGNVSGEFRFFSKSNPTPYAAVEYNYNNFSLIGRYKFL